MYESHFGMAGQAFLETIDPAAYVPLKGHEAALRRLRYGLERMAGPALVLGPSGTGKTLLIRRLIEDLALPAVHLAFPAMSAAELVAFLADELGAPAESGPGTAGAIRRVRTALSASVARGRRILLVVDEAHLIDDPSTFETLRLLQNFTTSGTPDLALVLVGAPELILTLPNSLGDRLASRCLLGPLSETESAAYINGRLQGAGFRGSEALFDATCLSALYHAADGLPRRLNRLADLALLIAYARELPRPDLETIHVARREAGLDALAA